MNDSSNRSIEPRVAKIVQSLLAERRPGINLGVDDGLREHGLTSLDMVKLVLLIEAEFDFMIAESEMVPLNFRSIATIAVLVEKSMTAADQTLA